MLYNTSEISGAVGIPEVSLRQLMNRGQFIPEHGRSGYGRALSFTRLDALQAAVILALRCANVGLRFAPSLWRVLAAQPDVSNLALYVQERPDGSDVDFVMAPADGLRPGDVPSTATLIDVGDLALQVGFNLDQIDARRIAADFSNYPFRFPFIAPNPDAPWSVFLAREPGEPDAHAIARMQDAVEAGRSLLLAGTTKDALYHLVAVADRMVNAQPVQVPAANENVH